jgi:hypothetical protein
MQNDEISRIAWRLARNDNEHWTFAFVIAIDEILHFA